MEPCLTLDSNYTCTQPPPKFNITRPNFCLPAPPTTEEPVSPTLTSTVISTASDIISTVITNASSTLTQSSITQGSTTSPSTSKSTPPPTEPIYTGTTQHKEQTSPCTTCPPEKESWVVVVSCCASLAAIAIVVVIIILYKRRNRRDNEMQDENGGPQPLETQNSTYGLIGKDEPDTGGNTYSVEKEGFSSKDKINNGHENKGLTEDDPKKEEKRAPVVQITEL